MSYTDKHLWIMLGQAEQMPYGPGQIALVDQVITQADAQHLAGLAFAARMRATEAYVFGGETVRAFITFAWCLAEFERNPAAYRHHYDALLWHFKFVVSAMTTFPEVPLDRTYAALDDMQRRWQEAGHSMHAVHACRHQVAAHIGDNGAAEVHYAQWCAAPRDALSDCAGCDPTSKARWLAERGRDEDAIALGESVLSGELTCDAQPRSMLVTLMFPYLRTGRLGQGRDAHLQAYRLHRSRLASLSEIASHVEFCARTGNEAQALEIVERHLGWLDRPPSPWAAMMFAASASHALRRAQALSNGEITLHRPGHGDREAGPVTALDLAAELASQATELGTRFDQRNGTGRVGDEMRRRLDAEPLVEYLPPSEEHGVRQPSTVDANRPSRTKATP